MPETIEQWERAFRKAVKADGGNAFRALLRKLDLPDKPELLVEGTIQLVKASVAYANMDGQVSDKFLTMQKYDPAGVKDAKYMLTFDICGKAFARVLVAEIGDIDLADLYGHPWRQYEVCGYCRFWVSRIDGNDFSAKELTLIQNEITKDLHFDHSEEELSIFFSVAYDGNANDALPKYQAETSDEITDDFPYALDNLIVELQENKAEDEE